MPACARKNGTDKVKTNHGCDDQTVTDQGSDNVFINGIGAVRLGDLDKEHQYPVGIGCGSHQVALSTSSGTVFVNGKGIGRVGDSYGEETIITGSPNVFAGG
jgi:uncharacterized Zn-binding protein involved in type VI secretion